jgi:hypothetical protein
MHSTHVSPVPRAVVKQDDARARLNWLLAANAYEAQQRSLFRYAGEEEQMLLMQRPVPTKHAYALFGLLLGALPPAAIFARLLGYGADGSMRAVASDGALFFLCLVMNVVCCLVGYAMGSCLSRAALKLERQSWLKMFLMMPLVGAAWGGVAGVSGGFFFFGVGAFFGAACAIPIGIAGFLMFAIFHRLLERGGMIEACHFLPLACGITTIIAALIMGM